MNKRTESRAKFRQQFCLLCRALVADSVEVESQRYWCEWAGSNTILRYPGTGYNPTFQATLQGLAALNIITRLRAFELPELCKRWPADRVGQKSVYRINDYTRLVSFSEDCPVGSPSEWQAYWRTGGTSPVATSSQPSFDESLKVLLAAIQSSGDPMKLTLKAIESLAKSMRQRGCQ